MKNTYEERKLSSSESTRISLEAVRLGEAGLNQHRQSLLNRVPNQNDWAALKRDSVTIKDIKDIAYLSAAIHDELIHLLKSKKLRIVVHSHPDYNNIDPSLDDREFLKYIEQKESLIVSYITGRVQGFKAEMFNDYFREGGELC